MGKINDSLLSGTSGRTGRIVVANLFGYEFTRIRPRRRSGPPTPNQALIQNRMAIAAIFMMNYRSFACKYFGKRVGLRSPFNNAFSNLLDAYEIDFNNETIELRHEAVMFAKGSLLNLIPQSLSSPGNYAFKLDWTDNAGSNTDRQSDQLQILYAGTNDTEATLLNNVAQRDAETVTINLLPKYANADVHVWAAFIDPQSSTASNSVYLGIVTIEA